MISMGVAAASHQLLLVVDGFLTDGVNLVQIMHLGEDGVSVQDCYDLDSYALIPPTDLARWRVVLPALST